MTLPEIIVQKAKSYIGQEELPKNSGFKNSWFQNLMAKVGWQKFQSWCAYFAMDVWIEAFNQVDICISSAPLIRKYANGSSLQTYINFQKSKEFHVQPNPVPGALVIFRYGNRSTEGHEGIVTSVDDKGFNFTSGNTSVAGSREGTIVADKYRQLGLPFNPNGLNILGFVNPIRIA